MLPSVPLPTGEVVIEGQTFRLRGLSRAETVSMAGLNLDDVAEMETRLLALATDTSLDEVKTWYATAPAAAVMPLVEKALALSGLDGLGKGPNGA